MPSAEQVQYDITRLANRVHWHPLPVVHTWRKRHQDFPQPIAELQAGLIWDWNEIQVWLKTTGRDTSTYESLHRETHLDLSLIT